MNGNRLRWLLGFLQVLIWVAPVQAHVVSQLFGEWKPAKTWEIEILFDAGYAMPEMRGDAQAAAPQRAWLLGIGENGWAPLRHEAERYLRECLQVKSGGAVAKWSVEFIDFAHSPPDFPELLNDGAYFRIQIIGDEPLKRGAELEWAEGKRPSLVLQMPGPSATYRTISPGQKLPLPFAEEQKESGRSPWIESFYQGFLHVLPKGLDHMLFVMGLFFYSRKWRPLLAQSLAFTLAHTVTLGLAAAGFVKVPGNWVEPLIALSIAVVALENLRPARKSHQPLRLAIVFGFGLIHGLGFAGALSVWLKPGAGFVPALLCANLGVEAAQATLLLAAWILTIRWHATPAYQKTRLICCLGIAVTGVAWMIQRIG